MSKVLPARIGICGIGQMGTSAAVCFKRAGFEVLLWGRNPAKLATLGEQLARLESWMHEHVGPSKDNGRVQVTGELGAVDEQAEVILDCITEDMNQKVALLSQFPRARDRQSLFLSATSGLSITAMGRRSGTAHLLAGAHFWNPPHLMPIVEVIRGVETPNAIMDLACDLVVAAGKIPVRVEREAAGFIGNRLLHALWREAIHLVEQGIATPADVDRVARLTFGLRLPAVGPFENMDLIGLDLVQQIQDYLLIDLARDEQAPRLISEMKEKGQLGMKTGKGFYDWQARDPRELVERRDRQILHQLAFLRELGAAE
jgi:3-hydroxybutyryl-CoA dehydrogenase